MSLAILMKFLYWLALLHQIVSLLHQAQEMILYGRLLDYCIDVGFISKLYRLPETSDDTSDATAKRQLQRAT